MCTTSTFSILFWIYAKRIKNNQAPLYARITINGGKLNISLKRRIDTQLWSPEKQRIKGTGSNAKNFNQYLDEVHSKLFQCYQKCKASRISTGYTAADFKIKIGPECTAMAALFDLDYFIGDYWLSGFQGISNRRYSGKSICRRGAAGNIQFARVF